MNKILVVDDEQDILDVVELILQLHGFEVITLSDCRKTIQTIINTAPDLIVLDINMGYCDGRKLCLELKNKHDFQNHILLFSANPEMVSSMDLYRADDVIGKPFDMHQFVLKMREHLPVV